MIELDEIFSQRDVTDYKLFIEKLKQLKESGTTTKDILFLVYQYFKEYVTYNYDELQIAKLTRFDKNEPGFKCAEAFLKINKRIADINNISSQTQIAPGDITLHKFAEEPYSKEAAEKLLDDAFIKVEGRRLTKRNKERLFQNYGEIIHIKYKPAKKTGFFKTDEVFEHDELVPLNASHYEAVYNNEMLIDGACGEYKMFTKKICKDLGIKHLEVMGIGTTGHTWSLIYLPEEQRWVHFDMTMVKFYQDRWIKEHKPYNMEDWVAASTSDIFKMQPTRKITEIAKKKCMFDKNNYQDLDIKRYVTEPMRE